MYSSAYIWGRIIAELEKQLTVPGVSSYLDDAEIVEVTETSIVLYMPSEYRKEMILGRFSLYIKEAMKKLFDRDVELEVRSGDQKAAYQGGGISQEEPFMFNPQFTFDRFVVGSSNRFAHAAAVAVANNPAGAYNPLFIYGQSGLGKTHLLYAIAGEIHREHPDYKIIYIKGDQFTNELIDAVQEGKNVEFRNKYRNADLFLVDDIQFIAGKTSTQEEFFHTFNSLYEAKKQIVLTSDRPPNEMQRLEDRLKTRFEWGLIADIRPPDYETRMAIIKNKAYSLGLKLPDDVCSYIAENITTNVRQIEGTVKKIMAYRDLTGNDVDLSSVSRAIKDMYKGKASTLPTPSLIIGEVSRFYSIEENLLRGTLKDKTTAEARQIAMYLIRELTNLSYPDIGKEFGKDHTTVIHSYKKVKAALQNTADNTMAKNIQEITANINSKL